MSGTADENPILRFRSGRRQPTDGVHGALVSVARASRLNEVRNEVDCLNLTPTPGTYWMAVVQNDPGDANRSLNRNGTDGINAVGGH